MSSKNQKVHIGSKLLNQTDFPLHATIFQENISSSPFSSPPFPSSLLLKAASSPSSSSPMIASADIMSDRVRKRRDDVKQWKQSKMLDFGTKPWNKTTKVEETGQYLRKEMSNFIHDRSNNYQYNYRAESLESLKNIPPLDKSSKFHISSQTLSQTTKLLELKKSSLLHSGLQKRVEEMPVHPDLEYCRPWNSTTSVQPKTLEILLRDKSLKAKEWTKKRNRLLGLSHSMEEKGSTVPYIDPITAQNQLQESIREMKREKRFDRSKQLGSLARTAIDQTLNGTLRGPFTAPDALSSQEDPKQSGIWKYNNSTKSYVWSDDASIRPIAPNPFHRRSNSTYSTTTDLHTISTADDTYLR